MQDGVNKWAQKFDVCLESKCGAGTDQDIYGIKPLMKRELYDADILRG
jgi:hypothetical protein